MTTRRIAPALIALLAAASLHTGTALAQSIWRLEQPLPPEGVPFKVPLGEPGDLSFWAPNRGLLSVNGNDTIPRGLYYWNGQDWRLLATVCGGPDDTARIAWAGPTEFWVVSLPSPPRGGSGFALCRFKDGEVVGSWSTRVDDADPFRQMFSATCNGPDDCWFAGVGSQDSLGERIGAFHIHWDGAELATFYGPQGRAVTDVEFHDGTMFEATLVGRAREIRDEPVALQEFEPAPRLLHRVSTGPVFANDPFEPALSTAPDDGTEMLALDSDGANLWAVGGGAASGPSAPVGGSVARPPLAVRLVGGDFQELSLSGASLGSTVRFGDVAAIPGTNAAHATAVPYAERRSNNAKAGVARIEADGSTTLTRLPVAGAGRGAAARIACPAPEECWLVTWAGWLFHYTDGTTHPVDVEPAFQDVIEFRPNESAEQFVPDPPPDDDSQLFKPPPIETDPEVEGEVPSVLKRVRTKLHGLRLVVSFTVVRPVAVQLIARRQGKLVGRTPMVRFQPGRRRLTLRVTRERYPTKLGFRIKELG